MAELKSCPMCGRTPNIINRRSEANYMGDDYAECLVVCECGIRTGTYSFIDVAIRIWNNRYEQNDRILDNLLDSGIL